MRASCPALGTVGLPSISSEMGDREEKGERSTFGALARVSQSFALMGLDHLINFLFYGIEVE